MSCVHKDKDYKNTIVGSYLVIDFDRFHTFPSGQRTQYWKVKCVHCSNVKILAMNHIIYSHQEGCHECKKERFKGASHPNWNKEKCEYVTGMYFGKIKRAAEKRNFEFNITRRDMDQQFIKQKGKCLYTDYDLDFSSSNHLGNASLDRIDNSIGYVVGNIQWVHKNVNHMKMDLSHERFLEIIRKIAEKNFDIKERK